MIKVLCELNVGNTCDTKRERQRVTPEHWHRGFNAAYSKSITNARATEPE